MRKDLDIATFGDLLHHYPYRYLDRTQITPIIELTEGADFAQIDGTLINVMEQGEGRKRRLTATLYDQTGRIEFVWFGSMVNWLWKNLKEGHRYIAFGKVAFFNGLPQMSHPELEEWKEGAAGGMQPVYSSSEALTRMGVTNRNFARYTKALFEKLTPSATPELLPHSIIQHYNLCDRFDAFRWIHFPGNPIQHGAATYRLKFEELFSSQLVVGKARAKHAATPGWRFEKVGDAFNNFFKDHLPFELTGAQKRVLKEIRADTATGRQMNRLLQGDVGSGKTIVALMAMLLALDNRFQACLMAPTEILAQQHYASIRGLLEAMHIPCAVLTGTVKGKERKDILHALEFGALPIVVGTHALIEETVKFQNLGLAVIDEQHRFGVGQRARLWAKNTIPPHVLVMTATPIPRTLAMTLYGDLDVSVIDELPPGRTPIKTVHRTDTHRARVMDFVRSEVDKGRQAYIVYPLIEENEKLDFESLMVGYEQVRAFFPDHKYNVAMVHGRQDAEERARNMERFVSGQAHILVATTVIEVGVNVPNASVMVVESAERFGLSQLHQLRGRVGRGAEQSYCILLTGQSISQESRVRMETMVSTTDGFVIAQTDMELRGPGDIYGTRQSGQIKFRLADIVHDVQIMEQTREAADRVLSADPELQAPENRGLHHLIHEARGGGSSGPVWGKIS